MNQTKNIVYYLLLSVVAAALLIIIVAFGSSPLHIITIYDRLVVGSTFIASCIFGLSLATSPGWFKRLTKHGYDPLDKKQTKISARRYLGHHPDCGQFQSHTLKLKKKIWCAGCLGLSIGSLISIMSVSLYISIIQEPSTNIIHMILLSGLIIIALTYVEIMLPARNAIIHVLANVLLVVSFLLITISIFEITGNIIYGLLSILISFLWLETRIQLSNWQHSKTCNNCHETCKMY